MSRTKFSMIFASRMQALLEAFTFKSKTFNTPPAEFPSIKPEALNSTSICEFHKIININCCKNNELFCVRLCAELVACRFARRSCPRLTQK